METPCREACREASRGELLYALLVAALLLAIYGSVQLVRPHDFLWDDNSSFFLPSYVHGGRALFEEGVLAHINSHQYLGQRFLANGQSGVLYPPVYLAIWLSENVWSDLRATLSILAILHLMAAGVGLFLLLGRFGVNRGVRLEAALLWATLPFLAQVSRNWVFVSYAAAYLPLNLLLLDRLRVEPSARRAIALGCLKALLFYQGYVQYAVIVALFDLPYLLLWLGFRNPTPRRLWFRQGLAYAGALITAGALAMPLLLPMLEAQRLSAYRSQQLSLVEFLSNAVAIGPFLRAQITWFEPRVIHQASSAIFFFGLPNVLALFWLCADPRLRRRHAATPFLIALIVAVLALLLSTRAHGVLYWAPLLSKFRWPFKYILPFLFFATISVAGWAQLFSEQFRGRRLIAHLVLALGLGSNLGLLLNDSWNRPFGPYRLDRSVEIFRQEMQRRLPFEEGRVLSLWQQHAEPHLERHLALDFATLIGAYHLGGYDPLIDKTHLELALRLDYSNIFRYPISQQLLDYLSLWSVRHLIVPNRSDYPDILASWPQLVERYREAGLVIFENESAKPLVTFRDRPLETVPYEWRTNRLEVDTNGKTGQLRIALAPIRWWVWYADGEPMGRVLYDEHLQMSLPVPSGTERVTVRYLDVPFRLGVAIAAAFALSLAAIAISRRWRRPNDGEAA